MVERVLVVGPKDTISMVDDLAPKGFEIVKALHNSPEMKAAAGESKKTIAAETSASVPRRCRGVWRRSARSIGLTLSG